MWKESKTLRLRKSLKTKSHREVTHKSTLDLHQSVKKSQVGTHQRVKLEYLKSKKFFNFMASTFTAGVWLEKRTVHSLGLYNKWYNTKILCAILNVFTLCWLQFTRDIAP